VLLATPVMKISGLNGVNSGEIDPGNPEQTDPGNPGQNDPPWAC